MKKIIVNEKGYTIETTVYEPGDEGWKERNKMFDDIFGKQQKKEPEKE